MSTTYEKTAIPFFHRGLHLDRSSSELQPGEMSESTNVFSVQEGSIQVRTGHQRLTNDTTSFRQPVSIFQSIAKLRVSDNETQNSYYVGAGGLIFRGFGPLPASGAAMLFYQAASGCADDTLPYPKQRFGFTQYNAGTTGTPYGFFACPLRMLKDNGTTNLGAGLLASFGTNVVGWLQGPLFTPAWIGSTIYIQGVPYIVVSVLNSGQMTVSSPVPAAPINVFTIVDSLQQWGIFPPTRPVIATLGAVTLLPQTTTTPHVPIDLVGTQGGATSRISTTIMASSGSYCGGVHSTNRAQTSSPVCDLPTAPVELIITPASMTGILVGEMITINSGGGNVFVTTVDQFDTDPESGAAAFQCYCPQIPLPSATITAEQLSVASPLTIPTAATVDASFTGTADNAYQTDDVVHVAIYVSDSNLLTDLRFRVLTAHSSTDYYEKSILASTIQGQASTVSATTSAYTTLQTTVSQVDTGIVGDQDISNDPAQQAKPSQLGLSANATGNWTEIDIPKSQFLPIGRAGQTIFTWKFVTGFQIVFTGTGGVTVSVSSIYIAGGFGPNALVSNGTTTAINPYQYLYTLRNPDTQFEGDPCVPMQSTVSPQRQSVSLTLTGSNDSQIPTTPNAPSIAVYRAGGAFSDGLYRFIGYATNPGAPDLTMPGSGQVVFVDTASDASITSADTIEFDNDPPVTTTLPISIHLSASNTSWVAGAGAAGTFSIFDGNIVSGPDRNTIISLLKPGNKVTIATGTTQQEDVIIETIGPGASSNLVRIGCYFQLDHGASYPPGQNFLVADTAYGVPATLCCTAFDANFVAGNPYSPHTLYQSKTGQPEAFPVVELDSGIPRQINVGSPSDPIMAITEFNGQIICLNLSHIFVVSVFGSAMQAPLQSPAQRGLIGNYAWCKADNEIWYLAYDGIYSWSGGTSAKRSQDLDPLFKGITIGNYAPIDMTQAQVVTFAYYKNQIYVTYVDTNGIYNRLVYDTIYNRWFIYNLLDSLTGTIQAVTTQYLCEDTGALLFAKSISNGPTNAYLYLDDIGTTDGWVTLPNDGAVIQYAFTNNAFTAGQYSYSKQFSDFDLEITNAADAVTVNVLYDYSLALDPVDNFNITASGNTNRNLYPISLQNGFGKEAKAIQFRFSGVSTQGVTFWSNTVNFFSLEQLQVGRAFDWDDLGTPDDKRLYEVTFWYDAKNAPHIWTLDVITGIVNNQTVFQEVQDFTLEPLAGTFTGPTWTQVTFPINDNILTAAGVQNSICKKIRLRPKGPGLICVPANSAGGIAGQYGLQRWGIYKNSKGWLFKASFDGWPGGTNQVYIDRSTNNGGSYTDVTGLKVISGGGAPATGISVGFTKDILYILNTAASGSPRAMTVSRYDTVNSAWLTDLAVTPTMSTTTGLTGYGPQQMWLLAKPNGNLIIAYNGGTETISAQAYTRVWYSEYNGSTWNTASQIPGQSGISKDFTISQILAGTTNRVHFFMQTLYAVGSGYDLYHISLPDGGVFNSIQHLASDLSDRVGFVPSPVGLGVSYVDSSNIGRLAVPYVGGGHSTDGVPDFGPSKINNILTALDVDNPTWSTATFDTTTQVSGYIFAFEVLLNTAYDPFINGLYVFWVSPTSYGSPNGTLVVTSGNVMSSVNSGGGWSVPRVEEQFTTEQSVPSGAIGNFITPGVKALLIYNVDVS